MRKLKTVITKTVRASVPALTITVMDNEARVLDTALVEQLGTADPHQIRDLIKGHLDELEAFGEVSVRRTKPAPVAVAPVRPSTSTASKPSSCASCRRPRRPRRFERRSSAGSMPMRS